MLQKRKKYLKNKIVIYVTISFFILVIAIAFTIYILLSKKFTFPVEEIRKHTFTSFCQDLDRILINIEKSGELYCEEMVNLIIEGELLNQYDMLSRNLLISNNYITEITAYYLPDTDDCGLDSYNYCIINNNEIIFQKLDTNSISFHTFLSNPIVNNPIKDKKKYWSGPYCSVFTPFYPIIGTLSIPMINTIEDKIYGIVAFSFRMTHFDNIISKFNLGNGSYNVLLGNDGTICVHPLKKYLMKSTNYGLNISQLQNIKSNSYNISDTLEIDSLGEFKCNNSIALSYILKNNWRFLTIFEKDSFNMYNISINKYFILLLIIFVMLYLIIMIAGTNKIFRNLELLTNQFIHFSEYDILDWKLPIITSNDDVEILTTSFNILHKAYVNVQNKYTDLIIENEKLTYNKKQIDIKIKYAIKEETDALIEKNQNLTTSLANISEYVHLGKMICGTLNIKEITRIIYDQLERLLPVAFFGIYIYNKEKNSLYCEYSILNKNVIPPFSINIIEKNNMVVKCFDTNKAIYINNFDIDYRYHLLVDAYNPIGVKCASQYYNVISDNENTLGLFSIQCKEKGVFKDFNPEFLDTLKTYLDLTINNILNYRELQKSLKNMEITRDKLIQNEKMASVGQLSAGIAHEIKNPLNFIINFSSLSKTLMKDINDRVKEYKETPNKEIFEDIEEMFSDIKLNMTKIQEHSERLDKIIKNMLVHSSNKVGEFALIDINNIISEYVKLAYKGLRYSDPMFSVKLTYYLDKTIEPIYAAPNNISRVIINIITNACFAVFTKAKQNINEYIPEVIISTTNVNNNYIEITFKDNGIGIPDENKNKLFMPFFTTKIAGEGTGLGLSICYEIITQEHNGEIMCESVLGEYTKFIIKLPKRQNLIP